MEHLFSVWPEIAERVRNTDQVLLLSDFDGTLSPIASRPEQAVLPDDAREMLESLASRLGVRVGVISGRSLTDIEEKVGIRGITYVGNHGLEIQGPHLNFVYPQAESLQPVIRRLHPALSQALAGIEGTVIEDKGMTLSIHYRLVRQEQIGELKRICEETVRGPRSQGEIRTTEGKKVYEIRPGVAWGKGDAVSLLLSRWGLPTGGDNGMAFFLGDDLTDEGGFEVVNTHGGISVFVGEAGCDTAARYFLWSPVEVQDFLHRLTEEIERRNNGSRKR